MDKPVEKPLRDWRKTELYAEVLRLREALDVSDRRVVFIPQPHNMDGSEFGSRRQSWWDRLRGWFA